MTKKEKKLLKQLNTVLNEYFIPKIRVRVLLEDFTETEKSWLYIKALVSCLKPKRVIK